MRELEVSAPGKVILFGEHAVVYGKTALAVSVDLRTRIHLKEGSDALVVKFPDLNKIYTWRVEEMVQLRRSLCIEACAETPTPADTETISGIQSFVSSSCNNNAGPDPGIVALLYLYLRIFSSPPPLVINLTSDIPIGAGLGSSAAMSVSAATAFYVASSQVKPSLNGNSDSQSVNCNGGGVESRTLRQLDLPLDRKQRISDWAFMSEKIMHGTPSGIDNSVSTFGGVLAYRAGEMSPVSDLSGLQILLVNTNVPRNTRELVSAVRTKHTLLPKVINPVLDAIERISQTAISTLQSSALKGFQGCAEEWATIESLIDINQGLLAGLGVSHPALGKVVEISASHNIHAKLTGAGGGGFALGLITPNIPADKVMKAKKDLEDLGFSCYETSIGGEGVKVWGY